MVGRPHRLRTCAQCRVRKVKCVPQPLGSPCAACATRRGGDVCSLVIAQVMVVAPGVWAGGSSWALGVHTPPPRRSARQEKFGAKAALASEAAPLCAARGVSAAPLEDGGAAAAVTDQGLKELYVRFFLPPQPHPPHADDRAALANN
jgi:hypothetical protein